MVLNISSIFTKKVQRRPMLNQMPLNVKHQASLGISSTINQKNKFWKWFRTRPELNSPVSIRVDDTITKVQYTAVDGSPLGRNTRLKAEKFWRENFIGENLKSLQFDRLVTGSGFFWVGKATKKQLREVCDNAVSKFFLRGVNMRTVAEVMYRKAIDEDYATPRKVEYVASSTVMIEHDFHDVLGYIQWFSANTIKFKPDEIIHIPLHRIDGKVDGFTPVESLTYELILLWAIKENMLAYFRNGGSPSKAWILPEEISNSDNHKWLVNELMGRGAVENRHGNLVMTGKVEVQDLEPNMKDMDYKELALWVTSNIAYGLRVPVSRIPFLIGSAATKGDAGGMAESGYWAMIESDQNIIEDALNTQLFNKLGYSIKFSKHYKIDDLREAQSANMRMDYITKANAEFSNFGMKIKQPKLVSMISGNDIEVSMNDIEEMSDEEKMGPMEKTGLLNKSFIKDSLVTKEPDKINKNETKKKAAQNNPKNTNQTGF